MLYMRLAAWYLGAAYGRDTGAVLRTLEFVDQKLGLRHEFIMGSHIQLNCILQASAGLLLRVCVTRKITWMSLECPVSMSMFLLEFEYCWNLSTNRRVGPRSNVGNVAQIVFSGSK